MAAESNLQHVKPEVAAAQLLMQLSDEDNNISISISNSKRGHEQEVEQKVMSDTTLAKIHEIFGKDEVYRPKKLRKYRSLVNIYKLTAPIHEGVGFNRKENH